jgi:hypothetical protein
MERVWDRMTPEALRLAIRMALVELMLSGCTTAADHHNLFPPNLTNAIDIEVEEATKLGLRMTVSRGSMGISEKDGGLQPDSIVQDSDTILEDSERVLGRYHDPKPGAIDTSCRWKSSDVVLRIRRSKPFSVSRRSGRFDLSGRDGETRGQRITVDDAEGDLGRDQRQARSQYDCRRPEAHRSARRPGDHELGRVGRSFRTVKSGT